MANGYDYLDPYGSYGEKGEMTPYEMLMQMKSWNKEIYLRIEDLDSDTRSQISVLKDEINLEITNFKTETNTRFSVQDGKIESKVSQTDYNGVTVASMIQQTPAAVNIIAESLNMAAYVTFYSLTASGTTIIDGARIATGYISAERIAAGAISTNHLATGSVIADKIATGAIVADKIAAEAITADKIAAGAISANMITSGTLSGDRIYGGTIVGTTISGGTVSGASIIGGTLNTSNDVTVGRYLSLGGGGGTQIDGRSGYFDVSASSRIALWSNLLATTATNLQGIAGSRTNNLSFGYSASSNRLYVSLHGSDVGSIVLD